VMVVHVLKSVRGRPESEREEGERRECRMELGRGREVWDIVVCLRVGVLWEEEAKCIEEDWRR
jgi:hypothetical protein